MIFVIGFLAQICFSARIILQWMLSEKAKKVVSPSIFWKLSLIGAYLLFIYGWLRNDFAIILGQFISYYIYIWNLNQKKSWKGIPTFIRYLFLLTPVVYRKYLSKPYSHTSDLPETAPHPIRLSDDEREPPHVSRYVCTYQYG